MAEYCNQYFSIPYTSKHCLGYWVSNTSWSSLTSILSGYDGKPLLLIHGYLWFRNNIRPKSRVCMNWEMKLP
ncbi:hypothetical protein JHK85_018135 [Glycine max]|nr:hypothetical protein JHK85_018135 [Glycine max]